jgi:DNA-binding transcriptional LysR family regulator
VTDQRLRGELILSDQVLAVAAPAVAQRIKSASNIASALLNEPLLAYNLELSLIDHWLEKNRISATGLIPAMIGQDLRGQRSLLCQGFGWTVLPRYLCEAYLENGQLEEIPPPLSYTEIRYYLIWLPSKLRQPRIAHARQTLLWQLARHGA